MQRVFLLTSLFVLSQFVFSEEYQPVERYTIADGLPHSSITCLHTDSRDLLWIGTTDGLSRFNGISFYNYHASIYDTVSLPNDKIIDLVEDASGNIWCLTPLALSKYVPRFDGFISYYVYPEGSMNNDPVTLTDFAIDSDQKKIYILGQDYLGVFDIKSGTIQPIHNLLIDSSDQELTLKSIAFQPLTRKLLLNGGSKLFEYSIHSDSLIERNIPLANSRDTIRIAPGTGENYWIFSKDQIWINRENSEFETVELNETLQSNHSPIIDIICYENDRLEIITTNQVISFNGSENKLIETLDYTMGGFGVQSISSFNKMRCGVFWIGTNFGLYKFNMHKHVFKHHQIDAFLNSNADITSLVYDTNSYLWLGTSKGEVLVLDSKVGPPLYRLQLDAQINTLVNGFDGKIWAGTQSGLVELSSGKPVSISGLGIADVSAIYPLSPDTLICTGSSEAFFLIHPEKQKILLKDFTDFLNQKVLGIFEKSGTLYFVQQGRILQYNPGNQNFELIPTLSPSSNTLPYNKTVHLTSEGKVLIGTSDGIMESTGKRLHLKPLLLHHSLNNQYIHAITRDMGNTMWLSTNSGLFSSDSTRAIIRRYNYADGLNSIQYGDRLAAAAPNGYICFAGQKDFVIFQPDSIPDYQCNHQIEILDVNLLGTGYDYLKSLLGIDSITIDPIYRHMKFSFSALDYWNPEENRIAYSFVRIGKPADWIALDNENTLMISGLRAGLYSLKVDGTNHSGQWNTETRELIVKVNAPIWQSRIAIIFYGVFLVVFIYVLIYFRTKHLWKLNREYKEREIIAKQVELQKEELTVKNKNITDSINYAKRIQLALMPSRKLFSKKFPDSFILHMPKDIVSGDFYWINEVGGRIYFAAVDCTGHGVPGAFMSIIGFELFRRITEIEGKKQPAEILNSLSKGFETIFQDVENITLRDGMDVAFCAVDNKMKVLEFAGAFNPLYLVRDNTITEIKGDRCSVGLDQEPGYSEEGTFSDHVIQLREGDIIYIFTDGFADQFGGPEGKKYKYRRFRHLLLALHQLPMERQVEFLQRSILDWKGDLDQVDDILVMGIRVSKA